MSAPDEVAVYGAVFNRHFGAELRLLRQASGLSVSEAVQGVACSEDELLQFEAGDESPTISVFYGLAAAYGASPHEIATRASAAVESEKDTAGGAD